MSYLLLNDKFEDIQVVEGFESLIWTERYSTTGDFEIHTVASMAPSTVFLEDYYLLSTDTNRLMILEDYDVDTDEETGDWATIKGRSVESILSRRIVWGFSSLTGNLQNALLRLLNENALAPSDAARRIPNLTFKASTDPRITNLNVDTQLLGDNLLDVIEAVCKSFDIGFKITMPVNGQLVFELYMGTDRSYGQTALPTVIFSPDLDNLSSSTYKRSKGNYKTLALIGGEGEGSEKKFAMTILPSGAGTGMSRRELFVDASSMRTVNGDVTIPLDAYIRQLQQKGSEELHVHRVLTVFDGKILMLENSVYDVDFFMGDILQMENEYGYGTTSRVTEFIRSTTPTGIEAYPKLTSIDS